MLKRSSAFAFTVWALVLPAITGVAFYKASQISIGDPGYMLLYGGIVALGTTPLAALLLGLVTRTAIPSVLGAIVGIPLALGLASGTITWQVARDRQREAAQLAAMRAIVPVVVSGNLAFPHDDGHFR